MSVSDASASYNYRYYMLAGLYVVVIGGAFLRISRQPYAKSIKWEQYETVFKGTTLLAAISGFALSGQRQLPSRKAVQSWEDDRWKLYQSAPRVRGCPPSPRQRIKFDSTRIEDRLAELGSNTGPPDTSDNVQDTANPVESGNATEGSAENAISSTEIPPAATPGNSAEKQPQPVPEFRAASDHTAHQ
ncbi:hypothetical protein E4T42_09382 [Aureobasidium subglaciale]|nr:hypothetical protein E4T42_09382 [Aureobasidium subglaciale]